MPRLRRCPKCHVVGRMHRTHAKGAMQKIIRNISAYRRFHCLACDAYSWRWAGLHFSLWSKEYPVWLIVVLVFAALFLAQYIVSTNGCAL